MHDLDKPELVARILQAENSGLTIVFTRTKRAAQRLAEDLEERGFAASPLHGDMQQVAREKALAKFRSGKLEVLVATDVAARGIDVADVTHVINYSCPEDEKTYVHRIGRTGRAGATGVAVTFVDWADVTRWKVINKMLDLPFDEPAETYSTSEHFFHDMGIAPGTKGRLKPAAPRADRPSGSSSGGRSGGSSSVAAPAGRPRVAARARTAPVATGAAAVPAAASPSRATLARRHRQRPSPPRSRTTPRVATSRPATAPAGVVVVAASRPRARPTDLRGIPCRFTR